MGEDISKKTLHDAVYGIGPLAALWADKPHRLLILAADEIEKLRAERDAARSDVESVLSDTAAELGCKADNEEILFAIAALKKERDAARDKALEEAAALADHITGPRIGAAIRALKTQPKEPKDESKT